MGLRSCVGLMLTGGPAGYHGFLCGASVMCRTNVNWGPAGYPEVLCVTSVMCRTHVNSGHWI